MSRQVPVLMPKLNMAALEGTFLSWLVPDGAPVAEQQLIYTAATDKVEVDVEAPATGILRHGDVVAERDYPVGTQLGFIEVSG
jgi:pyruvate/2-oxoglutarate dehydrogenase complex dihydrolipoamide acyltransferase (E2) component